MVRMRDFPSAHFPSAHKEWTPLVLAAAVACLAAYLISANPPKRGLSGMGVVAGTFRSVLIPALTGSSIIFSLRLKGNGQTSSTRNLFALQLIWIGPAAVWLFGDSLWAVIPAVILVSSTLRAAWRYWGAFSPGRSLAAPDYPILFPLFASALILSAIVAALLSQYNAATCFAAFPTGFVAARYFQATDPWIQPPAGIARSAGTVVLAVLITALGLLRYLDRTPSSLGAVEQKITEMLLAEQKRLDKEGGGGEFTKSNEGDHVGVILWPEEEKHTVIVPPLPQINSIFGVSSKNPLSIPFFGVYWFFKAPDRRPPPKSLETKGSPVTQTFRTPDQRPIQMEAHQNLGTHIDLSCCSSIQIVVRNRDRYPGTVGLELRLIDTFGALPIYQTLGVQTVQSTPNWSPNGEGVASQYETLTFPIPKSPAVKRFDEFAIRYHMTGMRSHRSPNVGIERFILSPRGL